MTKQFTLKQLFSIVDGRLSTSISGVYDILNHITGEELMTHHLPVASNYLKSKSPNWYKKVQNDLLALNITRDRDFMECMKIVDINNSNYNIPQLKDEVDTSDFGEYIVENSLLLKKLKNS